MSPQAAINSTVMKSSIPKIRSTGLVNSRRDDDANADRHCTEQDRERGVVLLNNLFPKVIGSDLVDDEKRRGKNKNPKRRVNYCIYYVANLDAHLLASCVVVIAAVDRTIRARIVADRPGNIFHFIHRV